MSIEIPDSFKKDIEAYMEHKRKINKQLAEIVLQLQKLGFEDIDDYECFLEWSNRLKKRKVTA
jgi:mRNA-degrading endonuclease YafQ of YafQ-DinJ toxin-antitoxin module